MLTVLIKNDLEDQAKEELLSSITKKVDKVNKQDLWGKKDLAYPILKQTKAYFAHFEFEADPSVISTLDKSLKLDEDVIRYLLVRNDQKAKDIKKETTKEEKVQAEK